MRLAMAIEYFRIAGRKDFLQVHSFQMRTTVSSGSPNASATMRQPETGFPWGGTPALSRTAMVNCMGISPSSLGRIGGAVGRDGLYGGTPAEPTGNLLPPLGEQSGDGLAPVIQLLADKAKSVEGDAGGP